MSAVHEPAYEDLDLLDLISNGFQYTQILFSLMNSCLTFMRKRAMLWIKPPLFYVMFLDNVPVES